MIHRRNWYLAEKKKGKKGIKGKGGKTWPLASARTSKCKVSCQISPRGENVHLSGAEWWTKDVVSKPNATLSLPSISFKELETEGRLDVLLKAAVIFATTSFILPSRDQPPTTTTPEIDAFGQLFLSSPQSLSKGFRGNLIGRQEQLDCAIRAIRATIGGW